MKITFDQLYCSGIYYLLEINFQKGEFNFDDVYKFIVTDVKISSHNEYVFIHKILILSIQCQMQSIQVIYSI